jgi:hypothetical protein
MPHQDRDSSLEERPSERRQRTKKERDPNRPHKSSRSHRPKVIDPETGEEVRSSHRRRKDKEIKSEPNMSMADVVPELARTSSAPGSNSRSSLPYPSFSKAHSKEAVNSIEHLLKPADAPAVPGPSVYTPESTDLGSVEKPRAKSADVPGTRGTQDLTQVDGRPPTPPDTVFSEQRKDTSTKSTQNLHEECFNPRPSSQASPRSWLSRTISKDKDDRSKLSTKSKSSKTSKTSTIKTSRIKPSGPKSVTAEVVESNGQSNLSDGEESVSAIDSNATSVAPQRNPPPPPPLWKPSLVDTSTSPESAQDSSPKTPTVSPAFPVPEFRSTSVSFDLPDSQDESYDSPAPPPPPPPPMVPMNIPRVDYLMPNGGLSRTIPKILLAVTPSNTPQPMPGRPAPPTTPNVDKVFGPFHALLDQYGTVIVKNGSVAVATGYKSVARRLLERLEDVFARDLSSEGCFCVVCQNSGIDPKNRNGLSWGEVLEWVSGRRDIAEWPAFDFSKIGIKEEDLNGLGISGHECRNSGSNRPSSPVKLDPDIAEEFREHYLRQSKKTKSAVSKWLSSTPASLTAPPPDIDDDTLTFTILTHLDQEDRSLFNGLMTGSTKPVPSISRAPTPLAKARPDFLIKTGQSIQKLYRLPEPPRDPEACIYLLKNPHMHNLLSTLSGINQSEWEMLISGRFDGFLWSGAESEFPGSIVNSPAMSRNPTPAPMKLPSRGPTPAGRHPSFSRTNTPFSVRNQAFSPAIGGFPSRGPTPSQFMAPMSIPGTPAIGQNRGPISNDEEAEIAVLAEVEREIYTGMEALEDAFEALHRKAEIVRQALRERGAGLSMAAQARRASNEHGIFTRLGTPGFGGAAVLYDKGYGTESEVDVESDWGGDEVMSELAPDDSASNISSSRHRRPKRRNERRTPAPVEELDEGE